MVGPWEVVCDSRRETRRSRHVSRGGGRRRMFMFTDRLIVTLAFLRHGLTFGVLAEMFSVNRATIGRAVNEIRPLL